MADMLPNAMDDMDKQMIGGLRVVEADVTLTPGPLKALQVIQPEQSVLLGRSAFQAPGDGLGDITPVYEPVEDGGFRLTGGKRTYNRLIAHGQNRLYTGELPIFRMDASQGKGVHSGLLDKVFPLWARPNGENGEVQPCMGTLRIGLPASNDEVIWLDKMQGLTITTTFRPGYTDYQLTATDWSGSIRIAPSMDSHGLICGISFDRAMPLVWQYGGIYYRDDELNANQVEISGSSACITEPNLPNGLLLVGWDGEGSEHVIPGDSQQVEFQSTSPRMTYHIVAAWGVTSYDKERAEFIMARLDTPNTSAWPEERERLKQSWFDAYIGRALEPEEHFRQLLADPADALDLTCSHWDKRRSDFQIRTPDPELNALINWERCRSEYHHQGPGLVLSVSRWDMYYHISVGWYGKEWAGDHKTVAECLRLYAALQADDGSVPGIGPNLLPFPGETTAPYWVDHVWMHYTWTGNKQFIVDMWPAVRQAVAYMMDYNDADGDGLLRDWYEYWNCDCGGSGKGPKSVTPSVMGWAMADRAERMAAVLGDAEAEAEYHALGEKIRTAIFSELWNEEKGRLGCIGAEEIWRGHPQTWEEYLAVNAGLLSPEQGKRAMRWLESHYGFEPNPGVHLLSTSDMWPIVWSVQWVPVGDSLLAALAGLKTGDPDLWWPYIKTVIGSAFKSDFPGINFGIANTGAGGHNTDREDIDAVDPNVHVTVRGLFGIEPALNEGRIDICPAFPSDWNEASIHMPDVSYEWHRDGDNATFHIHTPTPTVKRVRASLNGPEIVTPSEKDSLITVRLGPSQSPTEPAKDTQILFEQQPSPTPAMLSEAEQNRMVLFDLASACNVTLEEFTALKFTFDCMDEPSTLGEWWYNPQLTMPASPRLLESGNGWKFLTSGRIANVENPLPKNLLALSSWKPYPLPAAVTIPVGLACESLCLLLLNYVHPTKNYIPNGEVVLKYSDGETAIESLIPPFNLDVYYQHFSRLGVPVPFGQTTTTPPSYAMPEGFLTSHADALQIPCNPAKLLESIELRATCSEGIIGLAGMTAVGGREASDFGLRASGREK